MDTRWISIKDHYPKEMEEVLLFDLKKGYRLGYYYEKKDGFFYSVIVIK